MKFKKTIVCSWLSVGVLFAAVQIHAQTSFTWNGNSDGVWANTANWNSALVLPTGVTNANNRFNVSNGSGNVCTYGAAQGYTVNTTTSGTRALVIGNSITGNLVISGGTLESRQVTGASPDVLGNGTTAGTLTISGGNYICTNGAVNELDMPINNSTVTVSNILTLNSGSVAVGTIYINEAQAAGGGSSSTISLNGGTLSMNTIKSGTTAFLSTINFNGGVLQALTSDNLIQYTIKTLSVQAGGAVVDSQGFSDYIVPALQNGTGGGADGGLTKLGSGTLTLVDTNTYTGGTTISNGTLALNISGSNTGSINNSTNISILAGATFDVSGLISPYNLSTTNTLSASGTGIILGSSAAAINGTNGGVVNLGSQAISLTYDGSDPALYISQGTLSLNGNSFAINTTNGSALAPGLYTVIQQASGSITSNGTFTVSGTAIGAGTTGSISVNGGNVVLTIQGSSLPVLNSVMVQGGTQMVVYGSGGTANGQYYVLSTTNLMLPLINWTVVSTNNFDGSGNFSFTNAINPALPVQFYDISMP